MPASSLLPLASVACSQSPFLGLKVPLGLALCTVFVSGKEDQGKRGLSSQCNNVGQTDVLADISNACLAKLTEVGSEGFGFFVHRPQKKREILAGLLPGESKKPPAISSPPSFRPAGCSGPRDMRRKETTEGEKRGSFQKCTTAWQAPLSGSFSPAASEREREERSTNLLSHTEVF